jgi:enolase
MIITDLGLRGILDSRATVTVEADVTLDGLHTGRGSCPRAIAPGRRERRRVDTPHLGPLRPSGDIDTLYRALVGRDVTAQRELDAVLDRVDVTDGVGASVTLAVSLAYARAAAAGMGQPLYESIAAIADTVPALPRLLVNVFSGGIHLSGPPASYQQVMVIPHTGDLVADIDAARAVWSSAAGLVRATYGETLSASSGIVVPLDSGAQLDLLGRAIDAAGQGNNISIGVDVAAEHLAAGDGRYRCGRDLLTAGELTEVFVDQARRHDLVYLEDPFDPADARAWRALRGRLHGGVDIVGDDLFATDARRVGAGLADVILLKLSQAGTLTGTVDAAVAARRAGMRLAVSHRSGETEDTAMCDVAVALGAEMVKVGGPRRGDRLAKYNQLLRLAERVPATSTVQ